MEERALLTYPTGARYTTLSRVITNLSVRDRRHIFHLIRHAEPLTPDIFFPVYGITLSEFAVWHVLGDTRRKSRGVAKAIGGA